MLILLGSWYYSLCIKMYNQTNWIDIIFYMCKYHTSTMQLHTRYFVLRKWISAFLSIECWCAICCQAPGLINHCTTVNMEIAWLMLQSIRMKTQRCGYMGKQEFGTSFNEWLWDSISFHFIDSVMVASHAPQEMFRKIIGAITSKWYVFLL